MSLRSKVSPSRPERRAKDKRLRRTCKIECFKIRFLKCVKLVCFKIRRRRITNRPLSSLYPLLKLPRNLWMHQKTRRFEIVNLVQRHIDALRILSPPFLPDALILRLREDGAPLPHSKPRGFTYWDARKSSEIHTPPLFTVFFQCHIQGDITVFGGIPGLRLRRRNITHSRATGRTDRLSGK